MSRPLIACAAVFFVSVAFAEDKKPEPKGEPVTGKITLDGKPLSGVTVTFTSRDDAKVSVSATTGDDGSYKATVPTGEYKITVNAPAAKKGDKKDPPKPAPAVPANYGDPSKTPLVCKVTAGAQTLDLTLNGK